MKRFLGKDFSERFLGEDFACLSWFASDASNLTIDSPDPTSLVSLHFIVTNKSELVVYDMASNRSSEKAGVCRHGRWVWGMGGGWTRRKQTMTNTRSLRREIFAEKSLPRNLCREIFSFFLVALFTFHSSLFFLFVFSFLIFPLHPTMISEPQVFSPLFVSSLRRASFRALIFQVR